MGKRRKAREIVLQSLYEMEFSDSTWEEVLSGHTDRRGSTGETAEYARTLLSTTMEHQVYLDEVIESVLQNWEMGRISLIDKNILRFALCEILYFPEIPPRVIINEAIEVAHRFSTHEAGKFVNGILDKFLKQYRGDAE